MSVSLSRCRCLAVSLSRCLAVSLSRSLSRSAGHCPATVSRAILSHEGLCCVRCAALSCSALPAVSDAVAAQCYAVMSGAVR
eukprot:856744-Rhodomonas_salina.1